MAGTHLRLRVKFDLQPCGIIDLTGKGPMEAFSSAAGECDLGYELALWVFPNEAGNLS